MCDGFALLYDHDDIVDADNDMDDDDDNVVNYDMMSF